MKIKILPFLFAVIFSCIELLSPSAQADDSAQVTILPSEAKPTVDGEVFDKISIAPGTPSNKLIEYVRVGETFDKWTKLVGYAYKQLPGLGNDPAKFAAAMGQTVKATNPGAQYQITENKTTGAIMIDFLTWPKDGSFMEFNVFRIEKSDDGRGIYTLQFANRFPFFKDSTEEAVAPFRKLRESWLQQAADFDMKKVKRLLN